MMSTQARADAERARDDAADEDAREALADEARDLCGNQIFNPTSMCA